MKWTQFSGSFSFLRHWVLFRTGSYSGFPLNESVTLGSNYRPWYEGKPDGGTIKNCGVVLGEANSWSDEDCSHESCTICDIPAKKALIMRGKIKFPSSQIKISNFCKVNFFPAN